MNASEYTVTESLRDGRPCEIRALRPSDRDGLLEAVANMSEEALYRRFFAPKRAFSEKEIDFFLNVDFVGHVALAAVVDGAIAGGGRYIVSEPGRAEVAFGVDDAHQGQGIALGADAPPGRHRTRGGVESAGGGSAAGERRRC